MEPKEIIEQIERQICFDAQADAEGRCSHHGGKCYELGQLVIKLKREVDGMKCPDCGAVVERLEGNEDVDYKCEGCWDWDQTRRDQEWDYWHA